MYTVLHYNTVFPAPPIICGPPQPPTNGSLTITPLMSPVGTVIMYYCTEGLFPIGRHPSVCTDVGGSGQWRPDPGAVNCSTSSGEYHIGHIFRED